MDAIKLLMDVVNVAQKSNDIEMVQKVISAQQEVINLQDKIYKLQVENNALKEQFRKNDNVEMYRSIPLITLKDEHPKILYCANCYGNEGKFIQLQIYDNDRYHCSVCKNHFDISSSVDCQKIKESLK